MSSRMDIKTSKEMIADSLSGDYGTRRRYVIGGRCIVFAVKSLYRDIDETRIKMRSIRCWTMNEEILQRNTVIHWVRIYKKSADYLSSGLLYQ